MHSGMLSFSLFFVGIQSDIRVYAVIISKAADFVRAHSDKNGKKSSRVGFISRDQ